jgi:hypothetical protein
MASIVEKESKILVRSSFYLFAHLTNLLERLLCPEACGGYKQRPNLAEENLKILWLVGNGD